MSYLAIDPGIHTGWAMLNATGELVSVGKGEDFPTPAIVAALIELPQVYTPGKSKGDPNNLITLAVRVGRYQERLIAADVRTELVQPTTWKGQIPKDRHHPRVARELSEQERQIVAHVAKMPLERGYSEDVWDAVALAKWGFLARRFAISRHAT